MNLCTTLILSFFSWDTYFSESEPLNTTTHGSKTIVIDSGDFYFYDCLFELCRSDNDGGSITFNKQNKNDKLLIESTVFLSCVSQSNGGAISFTSEGQCVLLHVCGIFCSAFGGNQFCSIKTTNDENYKNIIHESSISKSISTGTFNNVINLLNGEINVDGLNESKTNVHMNNFLFEPTNKGIDYSGCIKFSSFANNIARFSICIRFEGSSSYLIDKCNIILNKQDLNTQENGIVFTYQSKLVIQNTCIFKNAGNCIIDCHDGELIVDSCSIDFDAETIRCNNNDIKRTDKKFLNPILGFQTHLCIASYDIIDKITPIGFTFPKRTMNCFTQSLKRRYFYYKHLII